MEETGQEEVRPPSANSDNGFEAGFVEVTQEDARNMEDDWEPRLSVPAATLDDEEHDLYGEDRAGEEEGEGAAADEELDDEKPRSPPPSPADDAPAQGQLIDFGFSDAPVTSDPTQTTPSHEDPLLVAGPPEPLVNFEQISGTGGGFDLSDPFAPAARTDLGFGAPSSGEIDDFFGSGPPEPKEPTPPPSPKRDPTPPPPPRDPTPPPPPPPKRDPTPPPQRDPTPPPPPPKRDPTPEHDPTPPPPLPDRGPTIPSPPVKEATPSQPPPSGVETVTPAPIPPTKKGHMPKPRGYLSFLKTVHPVALYIIYWCDMKLSAVVLGVCLVVLLTLTLNTLLHTWVLLLLSFMVVSLTYIVSKILIDSFYNKKVQNPFSSYLEKRITLPEDVMLEWTLYAIRRLEIKINHLVRLLLFANIKHSLAFAVALWLASFVTNYLTLLSAMFVMVGVAFSVPWLYAHFQDHIDSHIDTVISKLGAVSKKVLVYLPFVSKKKAE